MAVTQNVTVNVIEHEKTDVAYLYKKDFRVDQNVINVFNEMGFNVTLINEKNMPPNFDKYRFVFIGDENFVTKKLQNINNYPLVIVNHYNGRALGLVDNDGVSQFASTKLLSVVQNSHLIQVYTRIFKVRRISLSYYFLDIQNKAPGLIQIAATQTTSAGKKFGDVISYANSGIILKNGKIQRGNLCFYGIQDSAYWTTDARNMFKDCVGFVAG